MPTVQLRDFRMHYVERGRGDAPNTLVFVHGFISTQRWWKPLWERLPDELRALAVDLRACGESDQIATGHTLAQYADDLEQFAGALGLERFTLVGHSLGGGVAMQYALDHGDRLQALVLANPLAPFGMRHPPEIIAWVNAQQGSPDGIRAIVLGEFATPPDARLVEELVEDGLRWGPEIYLGTMEDMARFDVAGRLSEVRVPTLVTWADRDTVIPFAGIAEAFTGIPGCALEVWHGHGHAAPIEDPARFLALLTQFVHEAAQPA